MFDNSKQTDSNSFSEFVNETASDCTEAIAYMFVAKNVTLSRDRRVHGFFLSYESVQESLNDE